MSLGDVAPTVAGADPNAAQAPIVAAKLRVPTHDALPRERLEARVESCWRHRLTLIVAPAGSGKTTLLARFAAIAGVPVAWYRAETWDAEETSLLRYLEAALTRALPGVGGGWTSVEEAASSLERWTDGRAMVVLDDLHALEDTAAELALGRFVEYAPPWLAIVAGTRVAPGFNLPRLRVSGSLQEIGPDDLRFRAWEAERLFRDFYRDPVPPSDLAALARRTEGWAAGLQLFHLATRGKSAEERRQILSGAGSSGRLVREYLAQNVLAQLPDDLRRFLVQTSALGRLAGPLCDAFLDRHGSAAVLDELAHRQIFTVALDDEGTYRYHEVLRAHLDRILVDELGEAEARRYHARAGELLEAAGASAEALSAYCRAEDWTAVQRLLGGQGERLAGAASTWIEGLPPAVVRHDAWLTLAAARGARATGRWQAALEGYARAESAFGASGAARVPAHERSVLAAWLDPAAIPPADWTGVLRSGVVRDPLLFARDTTRIGDGPAALVRGLLELVAGQIADARRDLEAAAADPDFEPVLVAIARVAAGAACAVAGDAVAASVLHDATEHAERIGQEWLARMGRILAELDPDVPLLEAEPSDVEDPWGATIHALVRAWTGLARASEGERQPDQLEASLADGEHAAATARRLGAGVLESWARGLVAAALAELGAPEAREAALSAESLARATGTPIGRLLAYAALEIADPLRAEEYAGLVDAVAREIGPIAPRAHRTAPARVGATEEPGSAATSAAGAQIRLRMFGGFALELDGRRLPLERVKPRARAVLRLLALHGGAPVHREIICAALWPDVDAATSGRSLHVAISALRGALTDAGGPDAARWIVREGDAYRLALAPDALDVARFDRAILAARAARARGEVSAAAFELALEIHAGDLLPEDGPAEWIVDHRERYRLAAVEAARALAEEALLAGQLNEVVRVCRRGLEIDRTFDPLWRLLIEARERAGDPGAATRDRRDYEVMLAALGIDTQSGVSAST